MLLLLYLPSPPTIVGATQHVGEPTEVALRVFAEKVGLPMSALQPQGVAGKDFVSNASWQVGGRWRGWGSGQELVSNASLQAGGWGAGAEGRIGFF